MPGSCLDKSGIYAKISIVKATRVFSQKTVLKATSSEGAYLKVAVRIEVFKIPEAKAKEFPDGYKVSMIAFREDSPDRRVLLDCHPPKGPHVHVGESEIKFEWQGLDHAYYYFWSLVEAEFGVLEEVGDEDSDV
jgi:hypothetical protein